MSPQPAAHKFIPTTGRPWHRRIFWIPYIAVPVASFLIGIAPAPAAQLGLDDSNPLGVEPGSRPTLPSPAAQAILATNPSLPWECARAAKILADLGEVDLAKGFLQKILAELAGQDETERRATLVDFEARFGLMMFYEMAIRPELNPEARQLADALARALDEHRRDLPRLKNLVPDLASDHAGTAVGAAEELRRSGGFAVMALLEGWAEAPPGSRWRQRILEVFRALGSEAVGPLRAVIQKGPVELAAGAAEVAGTLRLSALGPYLLASAHLSPDGKVRTAARTALGNIYGQVPGPEAAAVVLVRHTEALLSRAGRQLDDQPIEYWFWDDNAARPEVATINPPEEAKREALWLASSAARLSPDNTMAGLLLGVAEAEVASGKGSLREIADGADRLSKSWTERSSGELVQIYGLTQKFKLPVAGALTLAVLARREGDRLLLSNHVQPSVLVEALRHPDRRLRYFALLSVLQHAEDCHFAGASWLCEGIAFFLASEGKSRGLLATPNPVEAMETAGFLIQLGYEVDTARTGKEVFRALTSSPDFEFAFIDLAIDDPPVDVLLQQLAIDCRSALVPIGLVARAGTLQRAEQLAGRHPLVRAFSRPHSLESVRWQLEELNRLNQGGLLTRQERNFVAHTLLQVLAADVKRTGQIVSLRRLELVLSWQPNFPDRAPAALTLLGSLGTASSQATLIEFATRQDPPAELRRKAVAALADSIAQHGILLTTRQILRQYDLYNQLGPISPLEREILGAILDILEEAPSHDGVSPVLSQGF